MSLLPQFQQLASQEWRGMKFGLERMQEACENLGHPEQKFLSIHVAGTNGKGSVCTMLQAVLSEAGYKVGLYTSPHLLRINERFRIGDQEISDEELEEILEQIQSSVIANDPRERSNPVSVRAGLPRRFAPRNDNLFLCFTFFELCTLIAFLYFAKHKVDFAILEVGLGGRLDATNVVRPLVSVITEISLDHTQVLGDTLEKIATEKAGIIKVGVPVVCGARANAAKRVIEKLAQEKGAPFYPVGAIHELPLQISLPGAHQQWNAAIAVKTLEVLNNFSSNASLFTLHSSHIQNALTHVRWPGRLEWLSRHPPVLLDGAHNPAGVRAVVEYLKSNVGAIHPPDSRRAGELPLRPLHWKILFSAAQDKAVLEMLKILGEVASEIIICRMENSRSIDPNEIVGAIHELPLRAKIRIGTQVAYTFKEIIPHLQPHEGVLIVGSLYLVGEIKKNLTG